MVVRPMDADGDIMPVYNVDQMISGERAVSQVINLRLHFYYGEWWEDDEIGFRIPELLVDNARRGDVGLLSKYIAAYIAETQGVSEVTNVETEYYDRSMIFYCEVLTDDGETATVEVDLEDGVL